MMRNRLFRAKSWKKTSANDRGSYMRTDCSKTLRVPTRGARPLIRIRLSSSQRVIATLYRSEPRTVFGTLNRRCPKPILEDGCDINRQGRQVETRDGRYFVGERIKPIGMKPVENIMIEMVVLDLNKILCRWLFYITNELFLKFKYR